MAGIEFLPERHLDQDLFSTLQTNEYLRKGLNIMLIGATGSGKTYICSQRIPTDGFAEQNGRDAERAD